MIPKSKLNQLVKDGEARPSSAAVERNTAKQISEDITKAAKAIDQNSKVIKQASEGIEQTSKSIDEAGTSINEAISELAKSIPKERKPDNPVDRLAHRIDPCKRHG